MRPIIPIIGAFLSFLPATKGQNFQWNSGTATATTDRFESNGTYWLLQTDPKNTSTVKVALDSTGVYPMARQLCQHFATQLRYNSADFSIDSTTTNKKAPATQFFNAAVKSLRQNNKGNEIFAKGT